FRSLGMGLDLRRPNWTSRRGFASASAARRLKRTSLLTFPLDRHGIESEKAKLDFSAGFC
ncbi:hypothetical protein, partial [Paenibacillus alginolyticus]